MTYKFPTRMIVKCLVLSATFCLSTLTAVARDISLGMIEVEGIEHLSPQVWDRHFNVEQSANIIEVRAPVYWSDQELPDGTWRKASWLAFMKEAVAKGMHLKLDLETIASPPAWLIDRYPDARLVDQNGLTTDDQDMSYWWPGLRLQVHNASEHLLSMLASEGLLQKVDFVIGSFGAADEPIYPPQWTVDRGAVAPGFWCYDANAEADFTANMQKEYGTIGAANRSWGTHYAAWSSVSVPKPGTVPIAEWQDVISWYRAAKRSFVDWQIADTTALLKELIPTRTPIVEIPIPGDHLPLSEFLADVDDEAANDAKMVEMHDTEYLLDEAAQYKASAHFTGMPDMQELEYIRSYMTAHGYDTAGMLLTAENQGGSSLSSLYTEYTAEALSNQLDGFDYLYATNMFNSDDVSSSKSMSPTLSMEQAIANGVDNDRGALSLPIDFVIVQGGCVDVGTAASLSGTQSTVSGKLCLSSQGVLAMFKGGVAVWQTVAPLQSCKVNTTVTSECFGSFQGDGNFVLYNGTKPYWATGKPTYLKSAPSTLLLSLSPPYISLETANGQPTWDSTRGVVR